MAIDDKRVKLAALGAVYERINSMFAPTEASSTAAAAHPAGSYFILRGTLYKTTADIAAGDAIITSGSGQNCEAVSGGLGAEVSAVKSNVDAAMMLGSALGAPAHFTDGAAMPIRKITVAITPTQSGSGDPSDTNIRALSGYTAIRLHSYAENYNSGLTSSRVIDAEDGSVVTSSNYEYRAHTGYIPAKKNVYINHKMNTSGNRYLTIVAYDADKRFISSPQRSTVGKSANVELSVTLPAGTAYIRYSLGVGSGRLYYVYTDYDKDVVEVDVPESLGTIYAGELTLYGDGSGVYRARPYYASYDGETLTGPWISDRDVYAEGTSPTIGAQVVDMGGEITEYTFAADAAREISTLYGDNYISANGDTTYTKILPVTAEYCAVPHLRVDAYAGMIGPDEGEAAAENHASGSLIRSGNTLYRATAAIATGEAFEPGQNVTETTVITEIARIWAAINA